VKLRNGKNTLKAGGKPENAGKQLIKFCNVAKIYSVTTEGHRTSKDY
jgi:hypothetical protein